MADASGLNSIEISEHIGVTATGDNINAKRVAGYGFDGTNWQRSPMSFVDVAFDYVGVNTSGATDIYTFYQGGAGGTLVRTVTLSYSDSTKATLTSVART